MGRQFTERDPDPDAPVHACPREGESLTPCCGKNPFDLHPWRNRITTDPELVTCKGTDPGGGT